MTSHMPGVANQSPPPAGSKSHDVLNSIQTLRFLAAFAVVIYHAGIAGRHYGFLNSAYDHVLAYSVIGEAGVHIFFVISGFLMVYTTRNHVAGRREVLTFLRHRLERIYPIYWTYAALYLVLHVFVFETALWTLEGVVLALGLVPGYSAIVIGPGWTLGYEVYFYLAFGLSLFLPSRISLLTVTAVLFAMIAAGLVLRPTQPFWGVVTNTLLLEFVAGAWAAKLHVSGRVPPWVGSLAVVIACSCFAAGFFVSNARVPTVILWGIPSTLLVFGLVQLEVQNRLPSVFAQLSPLGNSSYSLYLLHTLTLDIVLIIALTFVDPAIGGLIVILSIAVSCVTGHWAYHYIERPLYRALRTRRKQTVAIALG